jgi:hypothetical protein
MFAQLTVTKALPRAAFTGDQHVGIADGHLGSQLQDPPHFRIGVDQGEGVVSCDSRHIHLPDKTGFFSRGIWVPGS